MSSQNCHHIKSIVRLQNLPIMFDLDERMKATSSFRNYSVVFQDAQNAVNT